MKKPVIFDCDPGVDDAVALAVALASDFLDIRLITTCAGNQLPEKTFRNARNLLALMGREEIEVAKGAQKPLFRELVIADDVHGESGLGLVQLKDSAAPESERTALEAMADVLKNSAEKVTIAATGPLTNIALLLAAYPRLKEKIELISLMGGACYGGNLTPVGEFNIAVDPEAADLVFRSGVPICMFGLDVTQKAQLHREDLDALRNIGNQTGAVMAQMLDFYFGAVRPPILAGQDHVEGVHMHDPCALAYLVDPSMFTLVECNVAVETAGNYATGCTVVDYYGVTGREKNALVAFDVDREKIVALIFQSIRSFQ